MMHCVTRDNSQIPHRNLLDPRFRMQIKEKRSPKQCEGSKIAPATRSPE